MGNMYEGIEKFGSQCYEWYKGMLLKERLLCGEMIELLLESVKPLEGYSKDTVYDEMSLTVLASRLFNDAEGAKHLFLMGLPSQAHIVIRDIIECTMLFRLFIRNSELAKRWLMDSKEYQLGYVNTTLSEMNIHAREYAFYGRLSHGGHANLLASISNVQEEEVQEGMRTVYHFGSSRNPETIQCIKQGFITMFCLLLLSLSEPLAEFYSKKSDKGSFIIWAEKVNKLPTKVKDFIDEIASKNGEEEVKVDQHIYELVEKKMRMEEFKIRLTGGRD